MPVRVFIAYAPEDEDSLHKLEKHLVLLQRQGVLDVWTKRRVLAGEEPEEQVRAQLAEAQLVVLLVSVDLLASDYCTDVEIAPALARHEKGEVAVVPVIVRACTWEWGPFARLQAIPRDRRPIEEHPSKDAAWTEVARELRGALARVAAQAAASGSGSIRAAPALPPVGSCFGRDQLVTDLAAALLREPTPRIPILGPAGIGKTTLSLAALHRPAVAERFGARRCFVRLEAAPDADAAAAAIATALRIEPGPDLRGRMLTELARGPAALVLDNLETTWEPDLAGTEALLAELDALPSVALVVSIRRAEQPGRVAWSARVRVQPLGEADAVDVFCGIAGEEHRNAPGLRPLLAKLGGVPLAITLLAHAAEGNDLNNLAEEWEARRTALLERGGGRDRETSWKASLELSLGSRRMTEDGRRLAALMGVLPDGVAQQDLRALLGDAGPGAARVLAQLELAYFEAGRLRMLAPVRELVASAHRPAAEDRARAMEHYRELAETLGPRGGRPGGDEAVERLAPEVANLDAVIRRGLEGGESTRWIDAALALTDFARFSGHGTPSPLGPALAAATAARDIHRQARCTESLGDIALARSEHQHARVMFDKALPMFRQVGDVLGEANCIRSLGDIALRRSEHEQARAMYDKSQPMFRQVGDVLGEANCTQRLGDIALRRSEHEQAEAMYEKAQAMYRQVGDVLGEANCIQRLGDIALARSEHEQAEAMYEKALPMFRQVGSVLGEATCIKSLGNIALERSEHEQARAMYEKALPMFQQVGSVLGEANCIQGLGDIARAQRDIRRARSCYEASLALYARIPDPYSMGWTYRLLAHLATDPASRHHHVTAARTAWLSIDRPDLVADLDREFP